MTKNELADAIKQLTLIEDSFAPYSKTEREAIRRFMTIAPDLDVIQSFIGCPVCDEPQLQIGSELDAAIARASSVEDFVKICVARRHCGGPIEDTHIYQAECECGMSLVSPGFNVISGKIPCMCGRMTDAKPLKDLVGKEVESPRGAIPAS